MKNLPYVHSHSKRFKYASTCVFAGQRLNCSLSCSLRQAGTHSTGSGQVPAPLQRSHVQTADEKDARGAEVQSNRKALSDLRSRAWRSGEIKYASTCVFGSFGSAALMARSEWETKRTRWHCAGQKITGGKIATSVRRQSRPASRDDWECSSDWRYLASESCMDIGALDGRTLSSRERRTTNASALTSLGKSKKFN